MPARVEWVLYRGSPQPHGLPGLVERYGREFQTSSCALGIDVQVNRQLRYALCAAQSVSRRKTTSDADCLCVGPAEQSTI